MKVYLFEISGVGWRFYSEFTESAAPENKPPKRGIWAWIERRYEALQQSLKKSESGVGNFARRIWNWLERLQSPDESMLRTLRNASAIKLHYPEHLTSDTVDRKWTRYLASRRRRHTIWLILNGLVTPISLLLAPIPGPNVIGWWFLYRAICHLLAFLGTRNAARLKPTYHPVDSLNEVISPSNTSNITMLAHDLGLKDFHEYVNRIVSGKNQRTTISDEPKVTDY
ncbi:MAG: hypothetical protein ACRD4L_02220 [Pyrinomonadaceae bacterium]